MSTRLVGRLLRPAVALSLTAFVLWWKTSPADAWRAGAAAQPAWIGLAVLLVVVDRVLNAYRWLWLLSPIGSGHRPPTWPIVRIFFTSTFAGTFLPGTVGGDLVRAYDLARLGVPGGAAAASVAMDRLLGTLSLLLVALIGLAVGSGSGLAASPVIDLSLVIVATICAIGAAIVFSARAEDWAQRVAAELPMARVRSLVAALVQATRDYSTLHRRLVGVLIASVGVQILRIMQAYCLGRALGMEAPLGAYIAFLPLVLLVVLLPLSINGIGTSQAAFVWLFSRVGTPESQAFALSVLFLALGVLGNLPGGLLYAFAPHKEPGKS